VDFTLTMNGRGDNPKVGNNGPWLLVGLSVRPLAEAAAAGGHDLCAIDAFGDRETLSACAGRVLRLPVNRGWRIGAAGLGHALADARQRYAPAGFTGIVACGGFEAAPELLGLLAETAPLVGNDANAIHAVREPRRWFSLLDRIDAPHPAVSFSPPTLRRDWLVKSAGGSGGWHVKAWHPNSPLAADAYFQRRAPGRPASALFLADGHGASVIGWQWQMLAPNAGLPWRYGGVMTANDMAATVRRRISTIVAAIVAETGLRGLCGLDFLVEGEHVAILELNPRPTASVALYPDRDLLALHRDACSGRLPTLAADDPATIAACGESVFYAPAALTIPADFPWQPWCRDVPAGAASPGPDEPVCTIRATGATPATVRANLARNLHILSTELMENCSDQSQSLERQCARRTASPVPAR
jgi:predicted ATP-grasp superfamily ATP-dependent carboligase